MLTVFWHMISNAARWPHVLMCRGVKQGCPDQPLTPGSFMRLCFRQSSIDKGHWRGHPLSLFSSIQLKRQLLNQCNPFIGTLIVLIDWHVDQLSVHWAPHNDRVVFSSPPTVILLSALMWSLVTRALEKKCTWNQVGVTVCKIWRRAQLLCAFSLLLDPISSVCYFLQCHHFWGISNHPLDLQVMAEAQTGIFYPSREHTQNPQRNEMHRLYFCFHFDQSFFF